VAHGTDVSNFESFKTVLEKYVKTVHLTVILDESIKNVDKVVPKGILPFAGTMQVYQLTRAKEEKQDVFFNYLFYLHARLAMFAF